MISGRLIQDNNFLPAPGSNVAVKLGCTCNRFVNGFGNSVEITMDGSKSFYVDDECPLHGAVLIEEIRNRMRQRIKDEMNKENDEE